MAEKNFREAKKKERLALSPEEILDRSMKIKERLFSLPEFARAKTIAFYVDKEDAKEVRTREMMAEAKRMGKRIVVPFVSGSELEFSEISGFQDLQPGVFNILEPRREIRRPIPPEQIDLMVVPGLAFDLEGRRVGYGKGFYDRFLRRLLSVRPDACVVGLAFEVQVVDRIPNPKPSDVPVSILVTEKRVVRFR